MDAMDESSKPTATEPAIEPAHGPAAPSASVCLISHGEEPAQGSEEHPYNRVIISRVGGRFRLVADPRSLALNGFEAKPSTEFPLAVCAA